MTLTERNLVAAYMIEAEGERVLLDKGYRPAFEALAVTIGMAEDYFQDRWLITPEIINK